jgi:hypothetical protein
MNLDTEQGRQEYSSWLKAQLAAQGQHIAAKGLLKDERARAYAGWAVPGRVCIGRIVGVNNKSQSFWVISGETPTDEIDCKLAKTARDAARHFALKWQLMAARVAGDGQGAPDSWAEVGDRLARTAEELYAMTEDDRYWREASPTHGTGGPGT